VHERAGEGTLEGRPPPPLSHRAVIPMRAFLLFRSAAAMVGLMVLALLASACGPRGAAEPGVPDTDPDVTALPALPAPEKPSDLRAALPHAPEAEQPPAALESRQVRAVWVHLFDDTLKTPASIDRMLDDTVAAGLNTVIVEVVRRQDAYYDSAVLPQTADPALPAGFDMLTYVSDRARERDLAVHAWFPGVQAYHATYDRLPAPEGWVWTSHGLPAPEADRWVSRSHTGEWGTYLDPGVPAVQDLLVATAAELAAYRIDAVHLDYVRYDGSQWGYHPVALARFQAETGRTDVPAPSDPQWSDWRRDQTRGIVARLRAAVAAVNPDMAVSAAVIAQGDGPHAGTPFSDTIAYREKFQDWERWVREGLVDDIYPMVYFDASVNEHRYEQWVGFLAELAASTDATVAVGLGAWLNTPEASATQLAKAFAATHGAVIYSYQQSASAQPYESLLRRLPDLWPGML
jgi:uncharacterized lipoprotein YddW (UPF0748 family)